MFRKTIFWAHLVAALAAGIFILIMSFTGVMLAYERQIVRWAEDRNRVEIPADAQRIPASQLAQIARARTPAADYGSLVFSSDPAEPVSLRVGRESSLMLDPYSGEVVQDAAAGVRGFLQSMEAWHRNLNASNREFGGGINRASNLVFLFLVISGVYLWFPPRMKWRPFRARMLFARHAPSSKARDFNWHHVFAFWLWLPLFVVVLSGVVISYPWASNMVYAAFGEEAPQRGGPPGGFRPGGGPPGQFPPGDSQAAAGKAVDVDSVLSSATAAVDAYGSLTIPLSTQSDTVRVDVELLSDSERPPRQSMTLDAASGEVVEVSQSQGPPGPGGGEASPGQTARMWLRFVHTGEQYGVIGQTLALLASLAACFLMYTGFALAYRRLIQPLFRK